MTLWFRVLEVWLTARLLASPTFRRAVSNIHQRVTHFRTGERPPPPHERGGAYMEGEELESPLGKAKKFGELFVDEFKNSDIGKRFRRS